MLMTLFSQQQKTRREQRPPKNCYRRTFIALPNSIAMNIARGSATKTFAERQFCDCIAIRCKFKCNLTANSAYYFHDSISCVPRSCDESKVHRFIAFYRSFRVARSCREANTRFQRTFIIFFGNKRRSCFDERFDPTRSRCCVVFS